MLKSRWMQMNCKRKKNASAFAAQTSRFAATFFVAFRRKMPSPRWLGALLCALTLCLFAFPAGGQETNPSQDGSAVFGILVVNPKATDAPIEPVRVDAVLDFTAYEPAPGGSLLRYDTDRALVSVALNRALLDANEEFLVTLQSEAENPLDALDFDALAEEKPDAEGAVRLDEGSLLLAGDGTATLTDGVNTLTVAVRGYDALLARQMEEDGVRISVAEGFVPAGSAPAFAALDASQAEALAARYLAQPQPVRSGITPMKSVKSPMKATSKAPVTGAAAPDAPASAAATGYAAFDLAIVNGDTEISGDGQYQVSLPLPRQPEALLPQGARQKNVTYALYHLHGDQIEQLDARTEDGVLSFTTANFSTFILQYTVDFEYIDPETGELYAWCIEGGDTMPLSDLLAHLGIAADLTNSQALFTDPSLVDFAPVTDEGGAVTDWTMTSLAPFTSEERLTLTLANGAEIWLRVTDDQLITYYMDAQGDTYEITLTYDRWAGVPEDAELQVREADPEAYLAETAAALRCADETYLLYTKFLDIAIVSGGEEIHPLTPVSVTAELLDVTDGAKQLQVVHFGEDGAELLESSATEDAVVSFDAESFSVFGFGNALHPLAAQDTELASFEILSLDAQAALRCDAQAMDAPEEGLEVLSSYAVSEEAEGKLWVKAGLRPEATLEDMETVGLYQLTAEGEAAPVLEELGDAGQITALDENALGVALIKDTGYRHLNLVLSPADAPEEAAVTLDGMMPKAAQAEAMDVTAAYANTDFQDLSMQPEIEDMYWSDPILWAVYDISIQNGENEYQPSEARPVAVTIADSRIAEGAGVQLWHIHDGIKEQVTDFILTEGSLSFQATGFSAYAIVQGPSAVPMGWQKITSMEDLDTFAPQGIYMGHPDGFYFMDTTYAPKPNRTGILKTATSSSYPNPDLGAVLYYLEKTDNGTYYAYFDNGTKTYIQQSGDSLRLVQDKSSATAFTIAYEGNGIFTVLSNGYYWNQQGDTPGKGFAAYNQNNKGSKINFWRYENIVSDPYDLDGKTYGLMYWNGGVAGKALMASSANANALDALSLTVLTKQNNQSDKLFVPNSSEISLWNFRWVENDLYYLTAQVNGSEKYLQISASGLALVDTADDNCKIQVVPGSGAHAGEIYLKAGGKALTYSGSVESGFTTSGATGTEWLHLVELSELTADYFLTYSASKVSVSDPAITNGSKLIVYTRSWDNNKKKYVFYAIDHDGSLVPCYESGDAIQWVGNRINSLLWDFTEYYWEGTTDPNYYYELYNEYSQKYIAPQITGGQLLSDSTIGINLNGRRNGYYYSSILAWDEDSYAYAGLKVQNGRIVPCPIGEAEDFYFAIMQDIAVDDDITTVPTVDHTQYGITMKLVDYGNLKSYDGTTTSELQHAVIGDSHFTQKNATSGLLSTTFGSDGYPTATKTNRSLSELFSGSTEVNHLFIQSTYSASGYYEFDSTQNFAHLSNGNFIVYKELGTHDDGDKNKVTLKHGQFLPYNDIVPGVFSVNHPQNLYSTTAQLLPDSDPRKYEKLYLVQNPDLYFGVEIEASFVQTPNGHDAWGHDIIYEFTGDDDFWLYVDGELIIDLGGIHSALPGSVNYCTGEVVVNGVGTTLKDLFYNNYLGRDNHTAEQAQAYVDGIFERNDKGQYVFKDYTTHTMRIFYMERGGGASNLHMRFNLASVKPGTVELSKELSGVDDTESLLAEFPFQIHYQKSSSEDNDTTYHLLEQTNNDQITVHYKDSIKPVTYHPTYTLDGITYNSVFMLKPGEKAVIELPSEAITYSITECGVNTDIFDSVTLDGREITGTAIEGHDNRKNFRIVDASAKNRSRAAFVNNVSQNALRTLTITKKLYDETGEHTGEHELKNDAGTFGFRLSFGTEHSGGQVTLADKHTYHVKDERGNYCKWDSAQQKFVPLGTNKTDYSALTDAEKKAASFTTSMNGAITRIPAYYTVEIREVLAGTRFEVEERSNEIPDGYSLQSYELYEDKNDTTPSHDTSAVTTVLIEPGKDPHVNICNLRGYGLRMYKEWNDAEYMEERADTYFAVFTADDSGNLTWVDGTARRLRQNENTLYWYFQKLNGIPFVRYVVREITFSGGMPTVNAEGVVTSYTGTITPIDPNGTLEISGRMKGETNPSTYAYTVSYEQGEVPENSNVRVDTVRNTRPGLTLKKQTWDGNPLAGATFALTDPDGNLNLSFTSDETGLLHQVLLRKHVDYTLTETKAPNGYYGMQSPVTLRLTDSGFTVNGSDPECYTLDQAASTLTLKNRPLVFQVLKADQDSKLPLSGVHFALHKQVTVGGVTIFDFDPMEGYDDLVTNANGILPHVDQTLAAGTYELREKEPLSGYDRLPGSVQFTISDTGVVSLVKEAEYTEISDPQLQADGSMLQTLTICNHTEATTADLTVLKKVTGDMGSYNDVFTFTLVSVADEKDGTEYPYVKTAANGIETEGTIRTNGTFSLAHNETFRITVPISKAIELSEENGLYTTSWQLFQDVPTEGSTATVTLMANATLTVTNHLDAVAPTGYHDTVAPYAVLLGMGLLALAVAMTRKKRNSDV